MKRFCWMTALLGLCAMAPAHAQPPATAVTVSVDALVVYGELDLEKAKMAVKQRIARALERCNRDTRRVQRPGSVKLSFLIARRGVPVVAVVEDTVGVKQLTTCIARRVQATRFPGMYQGARGELLIGASPPQKPNGPTAPAGKKESFEAPSLQLSAKGGFTDTELLQLISGDHWMSLRKCFPAGRFDVVRAAMVIAGGGVKMERLIQPFYTKQPKKHLCVRGAMEAWTFPKDRPLTEVYLIFRPQPK